MFKRFLCTTAFVVVVVVALRTHKYTHKKHSCKGISTPQKPRRVAKCEYAYIGVPNTASRILYETRRKTTTTTAAAATATAAGVRFGKSECARESMRTDMLELKRRKKSQHRTTDRIPNENELLCARMCVLCSVVYFFLVCTDTNVDRAHLISQGTRVRGGGVHVSGAGFCGRVCV